MFIHLFNEFGSFSIRVFVILMNMENPVSFSCEGVLWLIIFIQSTIYLSVQSCLVSLDIVSYLGLDNVGD